ncbi:MAG: InlB B-repeat-containing protein [Roseburia sp.]
MNVKREVIAIFCVLIFLVNDPEVARACIIGESVVRDTNMVLDLFAGMDTSQIHIIYEVNGGINHNENVSTFYAEELPFTFKVPVREGYNFAGWYTDSNYQNKITELNQDNAQNMILFAKWTPKIDNNYNVEMYSYNTRYLLQTNTKTLRECSYNFLNEIEIPGMPSTREADYLNNLICSESQCPQGICFTTEYVLITSYAEEKDASGSLLVFDRKSGAYLVTLEMKKNSHLGGIAFDGENVWICHSNSNSLERIPYEYIQEIASNTSGGMVDASAISDEYKIENIPSCITYYGGRLWVATHTKVFNSKMLSYSYDKEEDTLTSLSKYRIPSKVQGVAFDTDGTVYLSTSYGRKNSSYLKIYSSVLAMTKKPNDAEMKIEMPPCSEEIVLQDHNIYVLFESAGERYFEGTDGNGTSTSPIDQVLEVAVSSIYE